MKLAIAISLLSAAQSVQAGPLRWGGYLVERQAAETPERPSASGEAELTGVPNVNTTYAPTARIPETTTIISTASAADHEDERRPGDGSKGGSEEGDTAGKPAIETLSEVPELDDSLKSFINDDEPSSSSSEYIPDPDLTTIDIIGPSTTEEKSSTTSSSETTSETTSSDETITSAITPSETPTSETPTSEVASDTFSETPSSTSEQVTPPQRQPTGFPENTPSSIDEDITKSITQTQFLPPTPTDEDSTTATPTTSETLSETSSTSSESVIEPPEPTDERGTPTTTLTPSPEKTTQSSESSSESTTTEEVSTVTPPTTPEVPDEGRVDSPSGSPESTTTLVVTTGSDIEPPASSTTSEDEAAPIETPPAGGAPELSSSSTTNVESVIETPSEATPTSTASSTSVEVPEIPVGETTSSSSSETPGSTTVEITITSGNEVPTAKEPKQPSLTPVPQPSDEPEEPAQPEQPSPPETTNKTEEPAQPTTYEEPAPSSTSSVEIEPTTTLQTTSTSSTTLTASIPPGANPDVPTALPPPTITTSLSPQQSSANLQQARQVNDLYGTLSPNTPCFDGQYACVNGKVAECKGETFDISSCKVEGERCFALPAKEMEGVMVGCWNEAYAMAVLSGFGERYSKTAAPPKETKGEEGGDTASPGETFTQSIEKSTSTAQGSPTEAPAPPPADAEPSPTWLSSGESLFITINPNPDGTTTIVAEQAAPTEDSAVRTTQIVDGVPTVSVVSTVTVTQAAVTVTEAAVTVTEPAVTVTVTATAGGAGDRIEQITVSDFAEGEVVDLGMAP